MTDQEIIDAIERAGSWLPLVPVRKAFTCREALTPRLLEAVEHRAASVGTPDIRMTRLATFGIFFLAQNRDPALFKPLVQLLETSDPWVEDEWLFSCRLFFFGHRLLAGISPQDPQRLLDLALNDGLKPITRSLAIGGIGMLGAYGDIPRKEAIRLVRQLYLPMRGLREEWTACAWSRAAAKLHCREFQPELQWFLASGLLPDFTRPDISRALRGDPDAHLVSVSLLEPMVDIFRNVFPQDIRSGELGLLPNGQIPNLEMFLGHEPLPDEN